MVGEQAQSLLGALSRILLHKRTITIRESNLYDIEHFASSSLFLARFIDLIPVIIYFTTQLYKPLCQENDPNCSQSERINYTRVRGIAGNRVEKGEMRREQKC